MSIGSITNANNTGSSLASSGASIANNFDTFLSLLTTQLKNQNPLEPLDTNQFTQQLVQFTSVEQQLKTNEYLQALVLGNSTSNTTEAVSFIGKEITASTTMTELADGKASWLYNLDRDSSNTTITIKDAKGNEVYTQATPLNGGKGRFDWDGVGSDGNQLPDGPYQITIDARDENGGLIKANTQMAGIVESVDFSGASPFLVVGGSNVSLDSVTSVSTPVATPTPDAEEDAG